MKSPKDWSAERRETLFAALLLSCGNPPKSLQPTKHGLFRWNRLEDAAYAMKIDTEIGRIYPQFRRRPGYKRNTKWSAYGVADEWTDSTHIGVKTPISMLRNAFLRWYNKQGTQLTHEPKQENIAT